MAMLLIHIHSPDMLPWIRVEVHPFLGQCHSALIKHAKISNSQPLDPAEQPVRIGNNIGLTQYFAASRTVLETEEYCHELYGYSLGLIEYGKVIGMPFIYVRVYKR